MKNLLVVAVFIVSFISISPQLQAKDCVAKNLDNASGSDWVAKINDMIINEMNFDAQIQLTAREKFYHFNAPEGQELDFRLGVVDDMIERRLLAKEALRRGLKANKKRLAEVVDSITTQLENDQRFQENKSDIIAFYECNNERTELIDRLKEELENDVTADQAGVKSYYDKYPEKFTSPVQHKVSLMLLSVDPSLPGSAWIETKNMADSLVLRLTEGVEFSTLAAEFSSDMSASRGGDMGYIHKGMLGEEVEAVLEKMELGDHSLPVRLLDGWAIVQLTDRIEPTLNDFEKVKSRAEGLLVRDLQEQKWQELVDKLKDSAQIHVNEPYIKLNSTAGI